MNMTMFFVVWLALDIYLINNGTGYALEEISEYEYLSDNMKLTPTLEKRD